VAGKKATTNLCTDTKMKHVIFQKEKEQAGILNYVNGNVLCIKSSLAKNPIQDISEQISNF